MTAAAPCMMRAAVGPARPREAIDAEVELALRDVIDRALAL